MTIDDPTSGQMRTAMQELAFQNMLLVEALVELLVEKRLLDREEVKKRAEKLRHETRLLFPYAQ